ncbi:MAG: hypothetical protein ACP5NX_00410 [Candidatus Bilamarchaeaceae archaeon]
MEKAKNSNKPKPSKAKKAVRKPPKKTAGKPLNKPAKKQPKSVKKTSRNAIKPGKSPKKPAPKSKTAVRPAQKSKPSKKSVHLVSKAEAHLNPEYYPEPKPVIQEPKASMVGRCIARTFNLEEAKGISNQYEAAGYKVEIRETKREFLSLFEVWVFKNNIFMG